MKKMIAVAIMILSTSACAVQPSTYEDNSTPDQRNIKATGAAATEAARSNRSTNADVRNATVSHVTVPVNPHGYIVYDSNGNRDHRAELRLLQEKSQYKRPTYTEYYKQRVSQEFRYNATRKIDKSVDRLMDKIF